MIKISLILLHTHAGSENILKSINSLFISKESLQNVYYKDIRIKCLTVQATN